MGVVAYANTWDEANEIARHVPNTEIWDAVERRYHAPEPEGV